MEELVLAVALQLHMLCVVVKLFQLGLEELQACTQLPVGEALWGQRIYAGDESVYGSHWGVQTL